MTIPTLSGAWPPTRSHRSPLPAAASATEPRRCPPPEPPGLTATPRLNHGYHAAGRQTRFTDSTSAIHQRGQAFRGDARGHAALLGIRGQQGRPCRQATVTEIRAGIAALD